MQNQVPVEVLSVESQIHSMLSIVNKKKELIGKNEGKQQPLKAAHDEFVALEENNKMLKKDIEQDYKSIKQIIDFTEKNAGYIIETGPLFTEQKEAEKEGEE